MVCGTEVVSQTPLLLPIHVYRRDFDSFEMITNLTSEITFESTEKPCPVTSTEMIDLQPELEPFIVFTNPYDCTERINYLNQGCTHQCQRQFGKCP